MKSDDGSVLEIHDAYEAGSSRAHELLMGSRVIVVITAADGPTRDSELDALDLAVFFADRDRE